MVMDGCYIEGNINNVGKNDNNCGCAKDDDHDHAIDSNNGFCMEWL